MGCCFETSYCNILVKYSIKYIYLHVMSLFKIHTFAKVNCKNIVIQISIFGYRIENACYDNEACTDYQCLL